MCQQGMNARNGLCKEWGRMESPYHVFFLEKPYFENKMNFETLGEFSKAIEIPCEISGEPKPNITWYRDAEPLDQIPAVRYSVQENNSLYIR